MDTKKNDDHADLLAVAADLFSTADFLDSEGNRRKDKPDAAARLYEGAAERRAKARAVERAAAALTTATTITLDRVDSVDGQHFIARFSRPGRIDVALVNGKIIAYLYGGTADNEEQEPLCCFDGHEGGTTGWKG